jgi:hypothetical protein
MLSRSPAQRILTVVHNIVLTTLRSLVVSAMGMANVAVAVMIVVPPLGSRRRALAA